MAASAQAAPSRLLKRPIEQLERSEAMEPFDRLRAGLWNDLNRLDLDKRLERLERLERMEPVDS